MILLIVTFFVGVILGGLAIALVAGGSRSDYDKRHIVDRKRIEDQTQIIFTMRKELVEAKGAASSNELRADCLEKLKNDLQAEYDLYKKSYLDFVQDYRKLYIELDALKAAEARKFPSPAEIEAIMNFDKDFGGIISDLTTIEEMVQEITPKVLLAS